MPKRNPNLEKQKTEYIRKYITTSKEVCAGFRTPEEAKEAHSNLWFDQFYLKNNDFSAKELLNPKREPLRIEGNISTGHNTSKLLAYNGMWRIYIHPRNRKSLDFDISVIAGRAYRFHSEVIRHSITSQHGQSVYDQWRQIVKEDIDSLRTLVNKVKSRITSIPWSYTCSHSASNLCDQVGIKTYRGTAFIFPDSFGKGRNTTGI
jgi:hypothetical protein